MRIGKWAPILSKLTKYLLDLGSHSQPFPLKCWEVISSGRLHFSQAVALVRSWSGLSKPAGFSGRGGSEFYVQRLCREMVGAESGGPDAARGLRPLHVAGELPTSTFSGPWFPMMPHSLIPKLRGWQPWQCRLSATRAYEREWGSIHMSTSVCPSLSL